MGKRKKKVKGRGNQIIGRQGGGGGGGGVDEND